MTAEIVNLDALIPREDFRAPTGPETGGEEGKPSASVTDLTKGESFFTTLRKPDFQRETAAWSPNMIHDLVSAFIDGDLIPSVICWQSPSRLSFVIDGAHRLSAIVAWILDDYGDGDLSMEQYGYNVPDDQIRVARKTRDLIDNAIGSYKSFQAETKVPGSAPHVANKVRALAHVKIPLLWVRGNDPLKAEKAFFTINQSAVEIDPTELRILNARSKPNAISARAIVRNAAGHKYWKGFSPAGQQALEKEAKEVYSALYHPPLKPTIRTEELPVAGYGYGTQTLPLIFDFVNVANELPVTDPSKAKRPFIVTAQSDPDETETLRVMHNSEKLCRKITSTHSGSLGLHPAVYFYGSNGRHQPTTVLAVAQLMMDLVKENALIDFTRFRRAFEDFLVEHKMYVNQLTIRRGSMVKGYLHIRDYYRFVFDSVKAGHDGAAIEKLLNAEDKYQYLVKEKATLTKRAKKFSTEAKQQKLLSDVLASAFVCNLCHARIDKKAMQLGHTEDKKAGGLAVTSNAEWQHPFCNGTYKPWLEANSSSGSARS